MRSKRRVGWVAVCLCVSVVAEGGRAFGADSSWLYGIHWYGDPASDGVEVMTGGKGIWLLETVLTEDTGVWGLSAQLAKFQTAAARGHTLIIRIQPRWGLVVPGPNTPEVAIGDRMETFLPKVTDAAQQLADVAHIWQIGNEMNLGFEYDIGDLTPQLYVDKYDQIRNAIKSVSSSLGPQIVLLGPVAPVDNAYLGAMCDALIGNGYEVDGFAMHAYGGSRGNFMVDVAVQADFIDSKGFADKPIYITEWGAPVDPISDTNEAAVAQFLHTSFQDLADYNADPDNHDIVCACWFIYKSDYYWRHWSILYLHDLHPPGVNNDLYDAFQYACTLDLPAGEGGGSATAPYISRSPASFSPSVTEGQNAPDDTFTVANGGINTLNYSITDDVNWLSATPPSGTSTGEADTITVSYSTAALAVGQYVGTITISDPQAENNPQTVTVNLNVESQAPPTIVNPDFEDNGGGFVVATGWSSFGGNKWEGVWDAQRVWTQGVCDIPPNGECGVRQTISVTAGTQYRVGVYALAQTSDFDVAIGVDPSGGTDPGAATFGAVSTSSSWTQVTCDFTATSASATVFLRGRNCVSWWVSGKWCLFDGVTIEVLGGGGPSPAIDRSPATLSPSTQEGSSPDADTFTVANSGTGTLSYSITDDVAWLSVNPDSGTSTGEADTITVSYSTAGLSAGTYNATITISDPNATNNPQTIAVTLTVSGGGGGPFSGVENGNFEGGFYNDPDVDHKVANSWTKFIVSGSPKHGGHWDPQNHSPNWSQVFYESNWVAGIYQQASGATPGNTYTASVWVKGNGDVRFWVGIDPTGGTNAASGNVQWSSQTVPGGTWTHISKQVSASSSTITVFLKAQNPQPWNQNAWFDDAEFTGP